MSSVPATATKRSRPYLHEVDMLRALTALSVVGVHVTAMTLAFNRSAAGVDVQNAIVSALHFTREVFISITAMVLVYSYVNKRFPFRTFWRKRGLGVLLPYILWSICYEWLAVAHHPFGSWLHHLGIDLLDGNASFQLYYILLTIEFYLALPLILWAARRLGRHPWRLLIGSFILQMVMMYVDFNYVENGPFAATHLGYKINIYQWRALPLYQFYVVLGVLAALYLDQLRAFVRRRGALIVAGLGVGLAVLWGRFAYALHVQHQSQDFAQTVFQPSVVIFSLAITLFLYWLTYRWTHRRGEAGALSRFWSQIANASFGIYLIHVFILTRVLSRLGPRLPADWPVAVRVFLLWLVIAGSSTAICVLFLYTPLLSRLIGRPCGLDLPQASRRLSSAAAAAAVRVRALTPPPLARVVRSRRREEPAEPPVAAFDPRETELAVVPARAARGGDGGHPGPAAGRRR